MKDQLITLETAKLAKEKGFSIGCLNYYDGGSNLITINKNYSPDFYHKNNMMQRFRYEAPTQSLLQKWLREEKDMNVWLKPHYGEVNGLITNNWSVYVDDFYGHHLITDYIYIHGYEKALEAGLIAALKLIN